MTPSRTAMPILWSSSSLKPAASAMRMQMLSARSTLSSSVSSVISMRWVWADILDSGEVLVEKTGVWVSQRWSTSQCSPGTDPRVQISLLTRPDVHLDFHEKGIHAKYGGAKCFEEHDEAGEPERESLCNVQRNLKR